ncbi:hypothetical protein AAFF_G00198640 [Aldrovandia affinis]|uniref:Uncharacterized protein n=1 Tax=Aldrovandia affinis TaxID=143900 RepID=A0AAD7W640_9TELE|nr:hypothetical protein AAFF_G00198640 [Aldrovandia affinis]
MVRSSPSSWALHPLRAEKRPVRAEKQMGLLTPTNHSQPDAAPGGIQTELGLRGDTDAHCLPACITEPCSVDLRQGHRASLFCSYKTSKVEISAESSGI